MNLAFQNAAASAATIFENFKHTYLERRALPA
jgi:hypothetical protein